MMVSPCQADRAYRAKEGSAPIAKIIPNLVVLNCAVGCRRMFTWVVLLLISVLLRVYWQGPSVVSSRSLPLRKCWSC